MFISECSFKNNMKIRKLYYTLKYSYYRVKFSNIKKDNNTIKGFFKVLPIQFNNASHK